MTRVGGVRLALAIIVITALALPFYGGFADDGAESSIAANEREELRAYTPHEPIRINSDAELEQMVQQEGWSGDGTFFNPYTIGHYRIDGQGHNAIFIGNTTKWVMVTRCVLWNATNYTDLYHESSAVLLYNVSNLSVGYSYINGSSRGISIQHGANITMVNDNFYDDAWDISIVESVDVYESGGYFEGRIGGIAVQQNSFRIHIESSYINGTNMDYGIYVYGGIKDCGDIYITGNTIENTNKHGIYFSYVTGGGRIENNTISNAGEYGIDFGVSSNVWIVNNTIRDCAGYGAMIEGDGNVIYNNTFYHNAGSGDTYDPAHIQAYNLRSSQWYYKNRGNYWADWTSPDNDSDGIVDQPYALKGDSGSQDPYPLAEPPTQIPEISPYPFAILIAIVLVALLKIKK